MRWGIDYKCNYVSTIVLSLTTGTLASSTIVLNIIKKIKAPLSNPSFGRKESGFSQLMKLFFFTSTMILHGSKAGSIEGEGERREKEREGESKT